MTFTKIEAGKYRAENGYTIKSNADKNIFTGRMMQATFWYIYDMDGNRIDGAPTLKEAKQIVIKIMTFEESIKSKVYSALEDIAMKYPDIPDELHKEAMEKAVEWFMIHFYNKEV